MNNTYKRERVMGELKTRCTKVYKTYIAFT